MLWGDIVTLVSFNLKFDLGSWGKKLQFCD